jgi:hypothetical protein
VGIQHQTNRERNHDELGHQFLTTQIRTEKNIRKISGFYMFVTGHTVILGMEDSTLA